MNIFNNTLKYLTSFFHEHFISLTIRFHEHFLLYLTISIIFSLSVIFFSIRFREHIIKNKKYKFYYIFKLPLFIFAFFNLLLSINIFYNDSILKQINNLDYETKLFNEYNLKDDFNNKECIIKNIEVLNNKKDILKEECKNKTFEKISNLKNIDNLNLNQNKFSLIIVIYIFCLFILLFTSSYFKSFGKFEILKLSIFILAFTFIISGNFNNFSITIPSFFIFMIFIFISLENKLVKENQNIITIILNHFRFFLYNYSLDNIVKKDGDFFFIKNINLKETLLINIKNNEYIYIPTFFLFSLKNTNLLLKDDFNKKVSFDFEIKDIQIKDNIKIFSYLEETIKNIISNEKFYIEKKSYENKTYNITFIFENEENKKKIESFMFDRFYKINLPNDLFIINNIEEEFKKNHYDCFIENEISIFKNYDNFILYFHKTRKERHEYFISIIDLFSVYKIILDFIYHNKEEINLESLIFYIFNKLEKEFNEDFIKEKMNILVKNEYLKNNENKYELTKKGFNIL